jgi:hypothetical protein
MKLPEVIVISGIVPEWTPFSVTHLVCQKGTESHSWGKDSQRMHAYVNEDGYYEFSVKNSQNRPLKLYISGKEYGDPALLCDNTVVTGLGSTKVIGLTNFAGYIAMGLGMLIGNYLYINSVPQMPFYVTLGLAIPEFLIVTFLIHEPKEKAEAISKINLPS